MASHSSDEFYRPILGMAESQTALILQESPEVRSDWARVVIEDWRWKYNNIRPHRSLGYITSLKFAEKQIQQTEQNNSSEQCVGYVRRTSMQ